jgi:hypothetical protein
MMSSTFAGGRGRIKLAAIAMIATTRKVDL